MTNSLKDVANELFDQFELEDSQIDNLIAMESDESAVVKKNAYIGFTRVATFLVCAFFISMVSYVQFNEYKKQNIVTRIVAEVVKNHSNLKPLEVTSNKLSVVSTYFKGLDFSPYLTDYGQLSNTLKSNLIGGRYCSVQGNTAAQLRLQTQEGRLSTLFQANASELFSEIPDIDQASPIIKYQGGFEVQMWQEKGLLMVWVQQASSR